MGCSNSRKWRLFMSGSSLRDEALWRGRGRRRSSRRRRLEAAPEVPRGHRAIGRPALAQLPGLGARDGLAAEVILADAADEPRIVEREDVRAQQVEDEEHLGRPAADAADRD